MKSIHHLVDNKAGWLLSLHQTWDPDRFVPGRPPILIVPGYGMNSFIFSYHPQGASLEGYLAEAGYEVWRCDLRAQGETVRRGGSDNFTLEDLALVDVQTCIDAALERTRTGASQVNLIGASLGGTLMFMHVVLAGAERVASMVALGSPVTWVKVHPLIRFLFASPTVIGLVRFRGSRKLAEFGLPLLARHGRWLLSVYMNPEITDTSAARELVRTVENPNRFINRQIAGWIRNRELLSKGVNIGEALADLKTPLFCITARGDGIVPEETATFPYEKIGSPVKRMSVVGKEVAMAHADLFVSSEAHRLVYAPVAEWFAQQSAGTRAG